MKVCENQIANPSSQFTEDETREILGATPSKDYVEFMELLESGAHLDLKRFPL